MGSSTVHRYFPSRDDLLTALIVDAYDAVGAAAEQADSVVRNADVLGRWMSVVRAVRRWALAHRQEYALIFGSPVLGYQAPAETVDPAVRVPLLVLAIYDRRRGVWPYSLDGAPPDPSPRTRRPEVCA
jgi:AcrR family transcriptional regulator